MTQLDTKILLRVTAEEREQIQLEAQQRHMSTNGYIRSVLLGYPTEEKLAQDQRMAALEGRVGALEGRTVVETRPL